MRQLRRGALGHWGLSDGGAQPDHAGHRRCDGVADTVQLGGHRGLSGERSGGSGGSLSAPASAGAAFGQQLMGGEAGQSGEGHPLSRAMKSLLILYHSRTGGSEAMARAAADGSRGECEVILKRAEDARPDDLLSADGYIFACPENLASMSGAMKECFDRCYYPVLGQIEGRPYAIMICAGSDGEGAVRQIGRIAAGWRLKTVAEPLIICTHAQTPEAILAPKVIGEDDLARCRDLGAMLAAGLEMGVF